MPTISDWYRVAKRIYRTEGLKPLLFQGLRFAMHSFFTYETYYLTRLDPSVEANVRIDDFRPKIEDLTIKIVRSNDEADELEAAGFDFRSSTPDSRKVLEEGAIAICIFAGKELANMGWIATNEKAMTALREPPYKIDFTNGEVCQTASWTNPKYRRMGLRYYGGRVRTRFLLDSGIKVRRGPVAKGNIAGIMASAKNDNVVYAEARYLKILWWKSLKEMPLDKPVLLRSLVRKSETNERS